ncbi:hypothetical protein IMZ48_21315 [Candidatus Bathyarchaeota archaeon]|nr:hypothetical protein [Candidatus Bathyarchaeota archaeon]
MQSVKGVESVDAVADAAYLRAEAEEKDEDGGLDECEDGVVEQLGNIKPPKPRRRVELGDVGEVPSEIVEFDVWYC